MTREKKLDPASKVDVAIAETLLSEAYVLLNVIVTCDRLKESIPKNVILRARRLLPSRFPESFEFEERAMRVTTNKDDPDYHVLKCGGPVQVFLNGEKLEKCVEANEEAFYAIVHEIDSKDKTILDHSRCILGRHDHCAAKTKIVYGRVQIERVKR